jgi:predicted nucleic acid-binding protein
VDLPKNLIEIGERAFYQCSDLENIVIPSSVSRIGKWAFSGCSSLKDVTVPAGVTEIQDCTFKECSDMITVTIPGSVVKIGKEAFYGCHNLKAVTVPDGVLTIGNSAFGDCPELTDITIGASVTKISDYAFRESRVLNKVVILGENTKVSSAFADTVSAIFHVKTMNVIPAALRQNAVCAFVAHIDAFDEVERAMYRKFIKSSVAKLVELAAVNPALLQILCDEKAINAKIAPEYIDVVQKCGNAECIAIMLEYNANVLTSKEKKAAVTSKEKKSETVFDRKIMRQSKEGIEGLRFAVTGDLETFAKRAELKVYLESKGAKMASSISSKVDYLIMNDKDSDTDKRKAAQELDVEVISERKLNEMTGRLFELDDNQTLVKFLGYGGDVEIPSGVKSIHWRAFQGCQGLVSVTIPESVTEIGSDAFSGCTGLTSVNLPGVITKIDSRIFANCTSLTQIVIPENVTDVYEGAFRNCLSLREIRLPQILRKISKEMFAGCTALVEITLPENCWGIDHFAFSGCTNLKELHVSANLMNIGCEAFSYCSNLTIYAPTGSYAEQYAKENNIPFVAE